MRIAREIGIDMGHRVPNHGGKCKNLHGHRYRIEATLRSGHLKSGGQEDGMIMDFGFLKEAMMTVIDQPCDHGTCLWVHDPQLSHALGPQYEKCRETVNILGYQECSWAWGKLYVIKHTPTAENLAYHWFCRLYPKIMSHCRNTDTVLERIQVWETPQCHAIHDATGPDLFEQEGLRRKLQLREVADL